jgi:hypothetical protein
MIAARIKRGVLPEDELKELAAKALADFKCFALAGTRC